MKVEQILGESFGETEERGSGRTRSVTHSLRKIGKKEKGKKWAGDRGVEASSSFGQGETRGKEKSRARRGARKGVSHRQ